jgi:hypothetical protein
MVVAHIWLCEASTHTKDEEGKEMPPILSKVLSDYATVFDNSFQIPPARAIDHAIPLLPGSKAVNLRPYRYSYY